MTQVRALSPSRAADFMQCPLMYRFRVVDRIPTAPSPAAARGTLVHAVLERLFDLPAEQRTVAAAVALVRPQWARLVEEQAELAGDVVPVAIALERSGAAAVVVIGPDGEPAGCVYARDVVALTQGTPA